MNRREALQTLMAVPAVKSIAVADLKPTDVIVVECDRPVSMETREKIKHYIGEVWPNRKIVVFDAGLRMRIVREPGA